MPNVSLLALVADQSASQLAGAVSQLVPSGAIMSYGGSNAPAGWLICDGAAISRTLYANLFSAIGTAFGTGDGSTTFNLPDMRGRFVRYDDNMGNHGITGVTPAGAASRDAGRAHGSAQTQTTAANGLGGTAAGQTQAATTTPLNSGAASGTTNIEHTHGSSSVTGTVGSTSDNNGAHSHRVISNQNAGGTIAAQWAFGNGTYGGTSLDALSTNSAHPHSYSLNATGQSFGTSNVSLASGAASGTTNIGHTHSASALSVTGDSETRPINIALNAIIKV